MQEVLIDNINYELDPTTRTASVCRLDAGEYSGNIVIPSSIYYEKTSYHVTSIECCAFESCAGLTSITIPNSVISIEDSAFKGCTGLTFITIPNSVTSIGDSAFEKCSGLTSITIPNSVQRIGVDALKGTKWLKKQPNGVIYINTILYAYKGKMPQGTNIVVKEGTTRICEMAFYNRHGLTSIVIPNSVTSIGCYALEGTDWLDNQPDGNVYINTILYTYKGEILQDTSATLCIKGGTTRIGDNAFEYCEDLNSISIPDSVTSIGNSAFEGCKNLTSINIPSSVTSIGDSAFAYCENLTSITIPDSVTNIGDSAFAYCENLTSITIPDSVTNIGDNTLESCIGLSSITIPNGIMSIGYGAFKGCIGLTSITIPDSVTSIGNSAFDGCENLTSINIPDSVTNIGDSAFAYCENLTSITIPDSVTNIGDNTFSGCTGLTSIAIPNSVVSIGNEAFNGCTSLTSIMIPNSVTSIGDSAFDGWTGLTSIAIPNSVTSIGDWAFDGCTALTSIAIPNSVTSIGDWAFNGCTALTSITIPNSVTSIGFSAFNGCTSLTSITIPNSVTSIESRVFDGCTGLTSIMIPNSVTSIGWRAFDGCTGLTSITIPNSVNEIEKDAFKDCKALASIRIPKGKQSIFDADGLKELQDKIIEYAPALINGVQYELDSDFTAIVCAKAEKYAGEVVVPMRVEQRRSMQEQEESVQNEQEGKTYTVNRLGDRAFADCYELTAVTLPKSITEIGKDVFLGCENLQTIRVPQGMTDKFCQMGLEPWRDKIVEPRQEEYTILLNIARGYELGIGMARNLAQAVLCYAQAADKGCAEAAYHLGELYADGKGLPQDYQQAADWFGKAAAFYHPNGAARQQECLHIIEEEAARLAAFEQEQQAERQAQLARITAVPPSQKTILFFDTETNGLPRNYKAGITDTSNWPRLIQIGWLITDEAGNVLKRKSQLIYPHFTIDADVTRLTGITTAQAQREGMDLAQVLREFAEDAAGASLIVGHNIDFDLHVVGCELYRESMDYRALLNKPTVCTMQRSTNFCAIPSTNSYYSGYKYPTLTELYTKLFGRAFSGAHDALTDITATKDCYFELRRRGII